MRKVSVMKKIVASLQAVMAAMLLSGCPGPADTPTDTIITLLAIPGVTVPVLGGTPVTSLDADQYTGTISWSPEVSGTFAGNTSYTAAITLSPKAGYTLNGVAANGFTVDGAGSVTNSANSGEVTAVFPATETSTNADLYALTLDTGTLSPAFSAGTTAYTVNVPNATASITVTGTTADANAVLSLNNGMAQILGVGVNVITITVTAQDGTTTRNYSVTVNRLSFALTMINVPAGRFQRDLTGTNISVITRPYGMSQYEITRAQFLAIMGFDPTLIMYSSGTNDPVQRVNWYHAIAFCNKLSLAEGLEPVYGVSGITDWAGLAYSSVPITDNADWNAATAAWSNNGYRLPTEMEWMWAAMGAPLDGQGGGTNITGYTKAFAGSTGSNAIGDYAVYGYNSHQAGATTTQRSNPAGSKLANELGLYDMSGNAWEWCWDWYDHPYPVDTITDYSGAESGTYRTRRGGSWNIPAPAAAISARSSPFPYGQNNDGGFRVVRH